MKADEEKVKNEPLFVSDEVNVLTDSTTTDSDSGDEGEARTSTIK
jgi:hypothetical protein